MTINKRAKALLASLLVIAVVSGVVLAVSAALAPRPVEELLLGSVIPLASVLAAFAVGVCIWWAARRRGQ